MLTTDAEDESPEPLPLTADEPRVSHEGALQAGIAADHDAPYLVGHDQSWKLFGFCGWATLCVEDFLEWATYVCVLPRGCGSAVS